MSLFDELRRRIGRKLNAATVLEGSVAAGSADQVAIVDSWRGETDKAFEWLERAWRQHDGGLLALQTEPMLAPLRKDPRYPALRKKVGFTEP